MRTLKNGSGKGDKMVRDVRFALMICFGFLVLSGCATVPQQSRFIGKDRHELISCKGEPSEILMSDGFEILIFESTAPFIASGYWREDFDPYGHGYKVDGAYLMNIHGQSLREYVPPREFVELTNEIFWIDSNGKIIKYETGE